MAKQQKRQELPRKFKALIIPREIWLDETLSLQEKAFIAEIDSLDHDGKGCWASNSYFARFFQISSRQVQRVIKKLGDKNIVKIEVSPARGNQRILKFTDEYLAVLGQLPHDRSVVTPSRQKCRNPLTTETSLPHDRSVTPPHDILGAPYKKRTIPIPKVLDREKQREGFVEKSFDNSLGLGIEKARKDFFEELRKIFPDSNRGEATTFARMAIHFDAMIHSGKLGVGVYAEAVGWAKSAKQSTAVNRRGLFVAMVKERTGYKGRGKLLEYPVGGKSLDERKKKILAELGV